LTLARYLRRSAHHIGGGDVRIGDGMGTVAAGLFHHAIDGPLARLRHHLGVLKKI